MQGSLWHPEQHRANSSRIPAIVNPGGVSGSDWHATADGDASLIAIIDDDADISEALEEVLQDAGYRTVRYANGAEALHKLASAEIPAVIVLDLMMPQMDGWTFRVRQREDAALRDVPVIVVSADPSAKARAIDAAGYVSKPFDQAKLCAAIERARLSADRAKMLSRSLELERVRALGMLVASVAHEINNPLTYLIGNLELARLYCKRLEGTIEPHESGRALPKVVDTAYEASERIAAITKGLLTFGRAESGAAEANLTHALDAAIQLAQPLFRAKARLIKDWAGLPLVVGNEARLAQVFLNLLVNAAQAIEAGNFATNLIRVSAIATDSRVTVEIEDTGNGIAPEHLARVFEAFFTTKPEGEGTGIGLSLCKTTLEGYGGTISVRSVLGEGTTFSVTLRSVPVHDPLADA